MNDERNNNAQDDDGQNEATDRRLIEAARRLETDIAPDRDLWPGVEAAIRAPRQKRRYPAMFAQAAAVVLLVGASSGLTYLMMKDDTRPVTVVAPELLFDQVAFGDGYSLGPGFRDARGSVASNLEQELERLPAKDRAEVEQNLALIRTAIAEINAALEEDPDNALLQELLLKTYREELNVMRQVRGLTRDVMSRNDI